MTTPQPTAPGAATPSAAPLTPEDSRRLKLLRFPPIIGVIYIHAYATTIAHDGTTLGLAETNAVTDFFRILISECVARTAVPIFFLLAGYLFFGKTPWSWASYGGKLHKRLHSLLLPYLCWNGLYLALVLLAQAIPLLRPYFPEGAGLLADGRLFPLLNALLGLTQYPVAYHFWFVRDLLLLALLAPLLHLVLRLAALPFFLTVYLCWISGSWPLHAPAAMAVFFFAAGACCAIRGQSLFLLDRWGPAALIISLPLLLADVAWNTAWFNNLLHRSWLVIGVVALLYCTSLVRRDSRLERLLTGLSGSSFFVYAAHEPLLGILRLQAFKHVPLDNPWTMLLLYLAIPLLTAALLVLLHRLLARLCPRTLGVLSGGR